MLCRASERPPVAQCDATDSRLTFEINRRGLCWVNALPVKSKQGKAATNLRPLLDGLRLFGVSVR